jgi:L-fuconolactonase
VLRGLQALAAAGLSFDIVTLPQQLPAAVTAARSVPELTMVLDHLGGPPVGSGQGGRRRSLGRCDRQAGSTA